MTRLPSKPRPPVNKPETITVTANLVIYCMTLTHLKHINLTPFDISSIFRNFIGIINHTSITIDRYSYVTSHNIIWFRIILRGIPPLWDHYEEGWVKGKLHNVSNLIANDGRTLSSKEVREPPVGSASLVTVKGSTAYHPFFMRYFVRQTGRYYKRSNVMKLTIRIKKSQ